MRAVPLLAAAVGVVGANSLVLSPLAASVARGFGGSATASGVLTAVATYGAGTALSALLLAPRADALGLARALRIALAVLAAALAASALSTGVPMLSAAQAVAGLAAGICLPATYGLAAEIAPPGRTSEIMGKVLSGWVLSLVLGVAASALLADLVDWRLVYALMAAVAAAIALAARILPNTPSGLTIGTRILSRPGIVPALASVAGFMAAFYGLYAVLGPHLTERLGASTTLAGTAALAYGSGFLAGSLLDPLIDRHGAARLAPLTFGVLSCVYILLALTAGTLPALLAVCVLWGGANHLSLNLLVGALTALAPDRRGAVLGLYSATTYAAASVATLVFRPLSEGIGFSAAALAALACILPVALTRRPRRSRIVSRDHLG